LPPDTKCGESGNPACPIHHPQKQTNRDDGKWKAEQEKHREEEAIANATDLCVLAAISAAVPVRLMRGLLFMAERVTSTALLCREGPLVFVST